MSRVILKLCLLVDSGSRADIRASLSCLARNPAVAVTLVQTLAERPLQVAKRHIRKHYGNTVDIAQTTGSELFGNGGGETDPLSYYIFLPCGDWLSDNALSKIEQTALEHAPEIIYTDHDRVGNRNHLCDPWFKPDASYDYLSSMDYVGSLLCIRNSMLARYGGIALNQYEAERYRLLLRAFSEKRPIFHLALPLHHSRQSSDQRLSQNRDAGTVLEKHFQDKREQVKIQRTGDATYRAIRPISGKPKVTIVIPFKDKPRLLRQCLQALIDKTRYSNYEVLGISNRSQSVAVYRVMREFSSRYDCIRFFEYNIPFNFSRLVNRGADAAEGKYIVLMNNDIAVLNDEWLCAMLEHGQRDEIGVVGAKLLYPDDTIQHAGLSIQKTGYVGHLHKHYRMDSKGYMNRLNCTQNVSAVTGALCLFSKDLHRRLRGFDEVRFTVAFNDVDFCLRAEDHGYSNLFTPHAMAYHHESLSRGYEDTKNKKRRFVQEQREFARLYQQRLDSGDPFYNPNLDQHRDDFSY